MQLKKKRKLSVFEEIPTKKKKKGIFFVPHFIPCKGEPVCFGGRRKGRTSPLLVQSPVYDLVGIIRADTGKKRSTWGDKSPRAETSGDEQKQGEKEEEGNPRINVTSCITSFSSSATTGKFRKRWSNQGPVRARCRGGRVLEPDPIVVRFYGPTEWSKGCRTTSPGWSSTSFTCKIATHDAWQGTEQEREGEGRES